MWRYTAIEESSFTHPASGNAIKCKHPWHWSRCCAQRWLLTVCPTLWRERPAAACRRAETVNGRKPASVRERVESWQVCERAGGRSEHSAHSWNAWCLFVCVVSETLHTWVGLCGHVFVLSYSCSRLFVFSPRSHFSFHFSFLSLWRDSSPPPHQCFFTSSELFEVIVLCYDLQTWLIYSNYYIF